MAILVNTAEGGTNASTVTVGNSGGASGNAFDSVTAGVTYATSAAVHGSLGFTTSTASQIVWWNTTETVALMRGYFSVADPTQGIGLLRATLSSASVQLNALPSTGRVQLYFGSNQGTSPSPLNSLTVYRLELYVKTGTGDGQIRAAVYEGDSTTPWWDSGFVSGLTVASLSTLRYGNSNGTATQVSWDSIGAKTGTDATWGAWPIVGGAPTADAGSAIVVSPGESFTLDGSGSVSPNGSITNYAWTKVWPSSGGPTLTGAATATPSGTANAEGDAYTYQLTVTDSTSATDTDTVNVLVTSQGGGNSAAEELIWDGTAWR